MKTPKDKAKELVKKYLLNVLDEKNRTFLYHSEAIECAKIAVDNEYYSLREQVKRLKPSLTETLYLKLIYGLIKEEQEVKNELNKM